MKLFLYDFTNQLGIHQGCSLHSAKSFVFRLSAQQGNTAVETELRGRCWNTVWNDYSDQNVFQLTKGHVSVAWRHANLQYPLSKLLLHLKPPQHSIYPSAFDVSIWSLGVKPARKLLHTNKPKTQWVTSDRCDSTSGSTDVKWWWFMTVWNVNVLSVVIGNSGSERTHSSLLLVLFCHIALHRKQRWATHSCKTLKVIMDGGETDFGKQKETSMKSLEKHFAFSRWSLISLISSGTQSRSLIDVCLCSIASFLVCATQNSTFISCIMTSKTVWLFKHAP